MNRSGAARSGKLAAGPEQGAFKPLDQTAFQRLEHGAFLKGLLKPFKGKGELGQLRALCEGLLEALIQLAERQVLDQVDGYPYSLLPIRLTRQSTGAGTVFLRWRRADRSQMGVQLWNELITDLRTPQALLADLYHIEIQRIALNMQISLVHSIGRQAGECAEKMAQAEQVYLRRVQAMDSIHQASTME
ncbi:DUF3158 family protein [Azotobacter salinestris]|uniref:DUF3158 family protein n=1 Tax=Azotobacter salinestris TaxID=69964 RepID=UPI0032DF3270